MQIVQYWLVCVEECTHISPYRYFMETISPGIAWGRSCQDSRSPIHVSTTVAQAVTVPGSGLSGAQIVPDLRPELASHPGSPCLSTVVRSWLPRQHNVNSSILSTVQGLSPELWKQHSLQNEAGFLLCPPGSRGHSPPLPSSGCVLMLDSPLPTLISHSEPSWHLKEDWGDTLPSPGHQPASLMNFTSLAGKRIGQRVARVSVFLGAGDVQRQTAQVPGALWEWRSGWVTRGSWLLKCELSSVSCGLSYCSTQPCHCMT